MSKVAAVLTGTALALAVGLAPAPSNITTRRWPETVQVSEQWASAADTGTDRRLRHAQEHRPP